MDWRFTAAPEERIEDQAKSQLRESGLLMANLKSHLNGLNHRLDIQNIEIQQLVAAVEKLTVEMSQVRVFYQDLSITLPAIRRLMEPRR